MHLTSWRRLRYILGKNEPLEDSHQNKRLYVPMISAISSRIETFLDRSIELQSYTEYFDTLKGQLQYNVKAWPISSITSVYSDNTGEYDGSESEESNYYIGINDDSVVLDSVVTEAKKGLRVIYTGGLASHGTQSQFVLTNEGSTAIEAGNYVRGQSSYATGYVISKASAAITIEVLYGIFEDDETIEAITTFDGNAISNATADIDSVTLRCMAEAYPDIVTACEMELRYMVDHGFKDIENASTIKGGTTRRVMTDEYNLLPEVRGLLDKYRNMTL